jgi:hypothetical protein
LKRHSAFRYGATKLFLLMFYAPGLRNFQKFFKHGVVFLV